MIEHLSFQTDGQGLHEITSEVRDVVQRSGAQDGLCTVFVRHTSASLVIQENADFCAKQDLERFLVKLVPENDPEYTHIHEGADDMPSHIKCALTNTSIGIPFSNGELVLGTWQGVFLWEHRTSPHHRRVVVHVRDDA